MVLQNYMEKNFTVGRKKGHGDVNMRTAIQNLAMYFYEVARLLGVDRL